MNHSNYLKKIKNALMGFIVGDMVGVPYEFTPREDLIDNPIENIGKNLKPDRRHNVPFGAWSDDTSLIIATIDSIIKKKSVDIVDIFSNFWAWYHNGYFTYDDNLPFDVGQSTSQAIIFRRSGVDYDFGKPENNGNGGLMRILPIIFFTKNEENKEEIIKEVVSITHSHSISIISAIIYANIFWNLLAGISISDSLSNALASGELYSIKELGWTKKMYQETFSNTINYKKMNKKNIKSTGYVVDTLSCVFWAVHNFNNYNNSMLNIINLGGDTDTICALSGAVLGFVYGKIKWSWKMKLVKRRYLNSLISDFLNILPKY